MSALDDLIERLLDTWPPLTASQTEAIRTASQSGGSHDE